jgi:hypothetical protein
MARTKWKLYTETGVGYSWEEVGYIYCPNANLEKNKTGTLIQSKLANGANAYLSPEIKYNWEPIILTYLALDPEDVDDATFINNINSYIDNGTYVKVVDHEGGELFGIFTAMQEVWLSGVDNCKDVQITMARTN